MLPMVIGLGPPKSGTSALHDCLTSPAFDPTPCCSAVKEPALFFSHPPKASVQWSRERPATGARVLDFTTLYLGAASTIARHIKLALNDTAIDRLHFIVVLRDPVARALSQFCMFSQGIAQLEAALLTTAACQANIGSRSSGSRSRNCWRDSTACDGYFAWGEGFGRRARCATLVACVVAWQQRHLQGSLAGHARSNVKVASACPDATGRTHDCGDVPMAEMVANSVILGGSDGGSSGGDGGGGSGDGGGDGGGSNSTRHQPKSSAAAVLAALQARCVWRRSALFERLCEPEVAVAFPAAARAASESVGSVGASVGSVGASSSGGDTADGSCALDRLRLASLILNGSELTNERQLRRLRGVIFPYVPAACSSSGYGWEKEPRSFAAALKAEVGRYSMPCAEMATIERAGGGRALAMMLRRPKAQQPTAGSPLKCASTLRSHGAMAYAANSAPVTQLRLLLRTFSRSRWTFLRHTSLFNGSRPTDETIAWLGRLFGLRTANTSAMSRGRRRAAEVRCAMLRRRPQAASGTTARINSFRSAEALDEASDREARALLSPRYEMLLAEVQAARDRGVRVTLA